MTVTPLRLPWVAVLCACAGAPAAAQSDYPNKPIRLIVPFAPGGSNDIMARVIGQKIGESVTQQFVKIGRAHV